MARSDRANRSAIDLETARTIARIRRLEKEYGPTETGKRVGYHKSTVHAIVNGKRHARSHTALDQLGLRFSNRFCRQCGKPCVIVCKSLRCVLCELIELAKEGVVKIGTE